MVHLPEGQFEAICELAIAEVKQLEEWGYDRAENAEKLLHCYYNYVVIVELLERVKQLEEHIPEWIPLEERKPADHDEVWVCLSDGTVDRDTYNSRFDGMECSWYWDGHTMYETLTGFDNFESTDDPHPIYWMPITKPEPPKGI